MFYCDFACQISSSSQGQLILGHAHPLALTILNLVFIRRAVMGVIQHSASASVQTCRIMKEVTLSVVVMPAYSAF